MSFGINPLSRSVNLESDIETDPVILPFGAVDVDDGVFDAL